MADRAARAARRAQSGTRRRARRRAPPGTAPGTLVADPEALAPELRIFAYGEHDLVEQSGRDLAALEPLIGRHATTWINVDGLGDIGVIERLGARYRLHPLALEDVVNVGQRPKVESYPHHLFIVARMLFADAHGVRTEQVAMAVCEDALITFQERPGDVFEPVRERLRTGRRRLRTLGPAYLAYALLDAVVDHYFPVLEAFGERLEALELDALDRPVPRTMHRLREAKTDLLVLRRAIWPLRDMLSGLLRDPSPMISDEVRVYFRDCHDHAVQVMDLVENHRETASSLMDVYLSSLSNRMNEVMKVLTMFATVFIPLGFVAGLYGMNFDPDSPFNMPELKWRYGYLFALGIMATMTAGIVLFFVRRGWLGGDRERRPPSDDAAHGRP